MRDRRKNGPKVTNINQTYRSGYRRLGPTGKGVYRDRCRELIEHGDLYFTDLDEMVLYADLWEFIWDTRDDWRENGKKLSFIDRMGNKRYYPNPTVKMWRDAINDLDAIGSRFGFSPLSRKKLALESHDEEDPVEAILKLVRNDRSRPRPTN